ncbi:MAG TPA: hypothetical protein VLA11_05635 [Woeseiaceae bacterium]|jgi:hypothetical protein|nr:hypothetical protein [Woeseiaceae bacterium]
MHLRFAIILLSALACACVSLPGYDQTAYENATSLKARTLALVEKSGEDNSYAKNEDAIDDLQVSLNAAFEYANGVEHNNESAKNWRNLIGDEGSLVNGWLATWRQQKNITQAGVTENSILIGEAFDTIICLEANKRRMTSCTSLQKTDPSSGNSYVEVR